MPGIFSTLQKGAAYVGRRGAQIGGRFGYSAVGAAAGAGWGAISSDTSILGGALAGAGAGFGVRMGRTALGVRKMAGRWAGASPSFYRQAMSLSAKREAATLARNGRAAAGFFGSSFRSSRGFIKGLQGRYRDARSGQIRFNF